MIIKMIYLLIFPLFLCTIPHSLLSQTEDNNTYLEIFETPLSDAVYRYDENHLLQAIEHYDQGTLFCVEKIYWQQEDNEEPLISSKVLEDANGTALICHVYAYDQEGKTNKENLFTNLASPLLIDENGLPQNESTEHFTLKQTQKKNSSWQLSELTEEGEEILLSSSKQVTKKKTSKLLSKEMSMKDSFFPSNEKLSMMDPLYEAWNEFVHEVFNVSFLTLAGYYNDKGTNGIYNEGHEISDKVRITVINGILNRRADVDSLLSIISEAHGGMTLHYTLRPTSGWTHDLLGCMLVKFGQRTETTYNLAQQWQELIDEMGGEDGEGFIIHYAHSIGATETYNAKELLSLKAQQKIHVITLGSPTITPGNAGFASVTHYVSKRDGVCLADPVGYLEGWFSEDTNVCFLGSFWGVPLVDHMVQAPSYSQVIELLGQNFLKKYATNK